MKNKYNYDAKLAKLQQDFYIYYQKNLRQDFKKLEQERYKYLAEFLHLVYIVCDNLKRADCLLF